MVSNLSLIFCTFSMSRKAILLCAGKSTRFGVDNKLLHELNGTPICSHALNNLLDSSVEQILVVTGHQPDQVISALKNHCDIGPTNKRVRFIHNPIFAKGMGHSIATAMGYVEDADTITVCLGDMPQIDGKLIDALHTTWQNNPNFLAVVPTTNGKRGNPVLLALGLFESLRTLTGDSGARHILAQIDELVLELPVGTDAIFMDIDIKSDIN